VRIGRGMGSVTAGAWTAPSEYIRVPLSSLDAESLVGCDLYQFVPPGRYVLYASADIPVPHDLARELAHRQITHLFIRSADTSAYANYLIERIGRVAEATGCPLEVQAAVAYEGNHFLIQRVFDEPRAEAIGDLYSAVTRTVDLALERPDLARSLIHLTRHDAYSYSHSVNVAVFGTALALSVGRDEGWVRRMAQGLSTHDIGKARVPLDVLNHPGRLSEEQWAFMRQHPQFGIEILDETGFGKDDIVRAVAHCHHERNNGKGYPKGLQGDAIPFEARVCTICDVFDALTTRRPYRPPSRTFEGLRIMIDEMREEFDPELFAAFIRLFERME
jgi:HD-GYP domain-containing protein (c-di-GMP phosphodiesterase class II)